MMVKLLKKEAVLLAAGSALLSLFSLAVLGQSDAGAGLSTAFKPLADVLGGLFKIISEEPVLWLKVAIIIVLSTVLYLASAIMPAIKEHERVRILISIALSTGTIIIVNESFLVGLFFGYAALGIALLSGFTVFGTLVLWHTNIHKSQALQGMGRPGTFFSWALLALMLAALIGMLANLSDLVVTGKIVGSGAASAGAEASRSTAFAARIMDGLVTILHLGLLFAVLAAAAVLFGFAGGASTRAYHWAAGSGGKRAQNLEKKEENIAAAEEAWTIKEFETVKEAYKDLDDLVKSVSAKKSSNDSYNTTANQIIAKLEKGKSLGDNVRRQAWRGGRRLAKRLHDLLPKLYSEETEIGNVAQVIEGKIGDSITVLKRFAGRPLTGSQTNSKLTQGPLELGGVQRKLYYEVIQPLEALIEEEKKVRKELQNQAATTLLRNS